MRQQTTMGRGRKRRLPWSVLLPWLVTAAVLAASAAVVFYPREAELKAPPAPGRTGALIWGDGVFANALELEAWLRVRGVSYRAWARKHPAAVRLLAPEPPGRGTIPAAAAQKSSWADRLPDGGSTRSLLLFLVPAGAVLAVVLSRLGGPLAGIDLRLGIVASAVSVALGVAVASLLT